jgi:hypothetical protein
MIPSISAASPWLSSPRSCRSSNASNRICRTLCSIPARPSAPPFERFCNGQLRATKSGQFTSQLNAGSALLNSLRSQSCTDARWPPQNITSFPDMGLRGCSCGPVFDAFERNSSRTDRSSWPNRAHHRLRGVDGNRNGGLWIEPECRPGDQLFLAVRRRSGIPPKLLAGPEPGICGFRSIGARSPVRWDRCRPTLALAVCATGSARRLI